MDTQLLEKLSQIAASRSNILSEVSRKIILALAALAWAELFMENGKSTGNGDISSVSTIILTILYFCIEIFQYFYSAIIARKNLVKCKKDENLLFEADKSMVRLNKVTYCLVWSKVIVLLLTVIIMLIHYWAKLPL
ncbi:MAG: hypothetical protein IJE78_03190 [Bacteroidaceae bacterium]|nr:hypothetical protein [Bacteroidaceae bacterium]